MNYKAWNFISKKVKVESFHDLVPEEEYTTLEEDDNAKELNKCLYSSTNKSNLIRNIQNLLQQGYSRSYISKELCIKKSTLRDYISKINADIIALNNPGRPPKLNNDQLQLIWNRLSNVEDPVNNIQVLKEELTKIDKVFNTISTELIRRTIKKLGFTKKKGKLIHASYNSEEVINKRKSTVLYLCHFWASEKIPIFIDETGFQGQLVDNYFYTKKGKPPIHKTIVRTGNISVVCAITDSEMIGYQCFKKGITASDFACFLI